VTADRRPVEVEVRQGVMRPGWYWWAATFGIALVMAVGAVLIALHAQAESARKAELARQEADRRWCVMLTNLDDAYAQSPPKTETGINVAQQIHYLRVTRQPLGFGCPPR
jgi:hypothetical protein